MTPTSGDDPAVRPATGEPRYRLVDAFRAFAAFAVLGAHVALSYGFFRGTVRLDLEWYPRLLWLAQEGVALFFVISGFVLYLPFVAARLGSIDRLRIRAYSVRRALRIVPAYWLALTVVVLVNGAGAVLEPGGPLPYYAFAQIYRVDTIPHGLPQAWTLCVEITFYALLPLWALLVGRVRSTARSPSAVLRVELVGAALLFAFSTAWKLGVVGLLDPGANPRRPGLLSLPAYLDHFALGMALAAICAAVAAGWSPPRWARVVERRPWAPWIPAALGLIVLWDRSGGQLDPVSRGYVWHRTLEAVVAALLLMPAVIGARRRDRIRRALAAPPLLWLGVVSYAVYLWHVDITDWLIDLGGDDGGLAVLLVLATAATVGVAAASWYLLERRAIGLGRRITKRTRDRAGRGRSSPPAAPGREDARRE